MAARHLELEGTRFQGRNWPNVKECVKKAIIDAVTRANPADDWRSFMCQAYETLQSKVLQEGGRFSEGVVESACDFLLAWIEIEDAAGKPGRLAKAYNAALPSQRASTVTKLVSDCIADVRNAINAGEFSKTLGYGFSKDQMRAVRVVHEIANEVVDLLHAARSGSGRDLDWVRRVLDDETVEQASVPRLTDPLECPGAWVERYSASHHEFAHRKGPLHTDSKRISLAGHPEKIDELMYFMRTYRVPERACYADAEDAREAEDRDMDRVSFRADGTLSPQERHVLLRELRRRSAETAGQTTGDGRLLPAPENDNATGDADGGSEDDWQECAEAFDEPELSAGAVAERTMPDDPVRARHYRRALMEALGGNAATAEPPLERTAASREVREELARVCGGTEEYLCMAFYSQYGPYKRDPDFPPHWRDKNGYICSQAEIARRQGITPHDLTNRMKATLADIRARLVASAFLKPD